MHDQPAQWLPKHTLAQRWYVVFGKGYSEGHDWTWWWIFTWHRPRFRHCAAVCQPMPGVIYVVDPLRNYLLVDFTYGELHEWLAPFFGTGYRVLAIDRPVNVYSAQHLVPRTIVRGPLLTCASVLGYFFGLRRWISTPWQLYRALKAVGALELSIHERDQNTLHRRSRAEDPEAGPSVETAAGADSATAAEGASAPRT